TARYLPPDGRELPLDLRLISKSLGPARGMASAPPTRMTDLRGRVVVLIGASSGLGRALSIELARRGANLVVAARREHALVDVANECERLGVRAAAVPADVTYEVDVHHVASIALERFGRIDVWINNAGVTYFARLE